jgi:hypothetical protein
MAQVEDAPGNLAGMGKLEELAKKKPRAKVFRLERDKQADVLAAFKLLKKDFDPASFAQLGVGATPARYAGALGDIMRKPTVAVCRFDACQ